jgi:hypothetical protein
MTTLALALSLLAAVFICLAIGVALWLAAARLALTIADSTKEEVQETPLLGSPQQRFADQNADLPRARDERLSGNFGRDLSGESVVAGIAKG